MPATVTHWLTDDERRRIPAPVLRAGSRCDAMTANPRSESGHLNELLASPLIGSEMRMPSNQFRRITLDPDDPRSGRASAGNCRCAAGTGRCQPGDRRPVCPASPRSFVHTVRATMERQAGSRASYLKSGPDRFIISLRSNKLL
jgi:hypothetical protein